MEHTQDELQNVENLIHNVAKAIGGAMSDYKDVMFNFSEQQLRDYLGTEVINTLVEWMPSGKSLLTKARLISYIDKIHGLDIFKKDNFRKDLLLAGTEKEIEDISIHCLTKSERYGASPRELVEVISKKPWGQNKVTLYLIKLWNLPVDILESEKGDDIFKNFLAAGERFYELLDYQYFIKQQAMNVLTSGNILQRMLVHMPTGTGKTKTSMHIIVDYINFHLHKSGIVIWVAHTKELLLQAFSTFEEIWGHLGDGEINAYKFWGSLNSEEDEISDGIVFCGLQKLMSIAKNNSVMMEKLKLNCRLIVFDEAHKAAANETKKVIEELMQMKVGYPDRHLIGLSATPGRTTEFSYDNDLLVHMFGNRLIRIDANILNQVNLGRLQALNTIAETNIIKYFQQRQILSKLTVERLEYEKNYTEEEIKKIKRELAYIRNSDTDFSAKQLKVLANNKNRNLGILKRLRILNHEQMPTIVFACNVLHAKMLAAMLTVDDIPNSLVLGDMDPIKRKAAIDNFKDRTSKVNIIINYDVLTTGFDSTNIECVFITRPTKSVVLYSQMIGRGLRGPMMGGNKECLLIDVKDNIEAFDSEEAFQHFDDYWN